MAEVIDTTFIIKDRGEGGALPDDPDELQKAVNARRRINEKAIKGNVVLKHAVPDLVAGETIELKGLGPIFSGLYIVDKHTLILSASRGLRSKFDLLRNAKGDSGETSDQPSPSDEALEGTETTTDTITPEPAEEIRSVEDVERAAGASGS